MKSYIHEADGRTVTDYTITQEDFKNHKWLAQTMLGIFQKCGRLIAEEDGKQVWRMPINAAAPEWNWELNL